MDVSVHVRRLPESGAFDHATNLMLRTAGIPPSARAMFALTRCSATSPCDAIHERGRQMLIRAGFDIAFECPAQTPMLLQVNIHPSREADLRSPDMITFRSPSSPMSAYLDLFGNRVTRLDVPPGLVTFSNRFMIQDSGEPDEDAARHGIDANRSSSRRRVAVPRFEPLLRQRQTRRFRLVDVRKDSRRLPARAGDLRLCSCENPLQLPRRAPDALRQQFDARRRRRVPRLRPSRHRALPLHEYSRRVIAPAISATSACRPISTRWISAPGSRSFSTGAGTRWTRVTTIRASAASSWDADATPRTSRSRQPLASPISCASKW